MNDNIEIKANIFGHIFKLSNLLQAYMDKELTGDGLTAKQFFLMIVINSFGENHPSFIQAAEIGGSSYQNVKQIAVKLERKGYLKIADDDKDKRTKRLILTNKCKDYWSSRNLDDIESMNLLFEGLDNSELDNFQNYIMRLIEGVKKIDKSRQE